RQRLGNAAIEFLDGVASPSYWVAAKARGRGVATAALRLMLGEAIARDTHRVELEIHRDNAASRRVAEKLGFFLVGTTKHPVLGPCIRYSLLVPSFGGADVDETVA
ncbi:MAG: GNAT family N-acetyltransferase, partial [Sciscionella sp.]